MSCPVDAGSGQSGPRTGKTAVLQQPGIRKTVLYHGIHYLYVRDIYSNKTRMSDNERDAGPYGCNSDGNHAFRGVVRPPLCRRCAALPNSGSATVHPAEEVVLDVHTLSRQHAAELQITVSVRAYLFAPCM